MLPANKHILTQVYHQFSCDSHLTQVYVEKFIHTIGTKKNYRGELGVKNNLRNFNLSPLHSKSLCSVRQAAFESPSESQQTKCANIYETRTQKSVTVCIPQA